MRAPKFIATLNQMPNTGRRVVAALLLAALALAVLAGSALAANLLKNASVEKDSNGDGFPNSWSDSSVGPVAPKRVCNQSIAGNCSLKMKGDGEQKNVTQLYSVSGNSGDTYKLTAWVKGKQIDNSGSQVYFALHFHLLGDTFDNEFSTVADGTTGWTKHTLTLTATGDFDYILVLLSFKQASATAWFDKLKLVEVP